MCVVCIKTGKEGRSLNPAFFSIAFAAAEANRKVEKRNKKLPRRNQQKSPRKFFLYSSFGSVIKSNQPVSGNQLIQGLQVLVFKCLKDFSMVIVAFPHCSNGCRFG